ncbi:FliH/SctL family protein [Thalassoroseus pseudoceratinae]|uniref:FliH/SctL family protein n=1 Tax=Thalassoroseus pseudoceratinae TaxID=2713176 RepID=UPI00141EB1A8|nr:FliH/SctL family protein [Thalassoroseus pseudoceratinae]
MGNPETKRVLKAGTAHSLQYEVAYNFEDLESRCQQYVEQVRQQTRAMIVEAQAEVESLKKTSHTEGYEAGYQAGISKAEQEIQKRIDAEVRKQVEAKTRTSIPVIQSVADTLAAQRLEWLSEWESKGIHLAVAIAERIIRREVAAHPENVIQLLQELLEMASGENSVCIYLHPEDAAFLDEQQVDLSAMFQSAGDAKILNDESVSRGGCVVRTEHGEMDARIETQLNRLIEELLPEADEL